MRRTLAVLVTTAALLVPATAASAEPAGGFSDASCSSGENRTGHTYNGKGNTATASTVEGCGSTSGGGSGGDDEGGLPGAS
jgi:hypothetical protein